MKKYSLLSFIATIAFFSGCDLDEYTVSSVDKKAIFSSEEGLQTYSISFYDVWGESYSYNLPIIEQTLTDYNSSASISGFILLNAINEENSGGWTWTQLRNVNYMIYNCTDPIVPEEVRNNFIGIARFFRAYFYYGMVRQFGDVPWIDHPLNPDETELLYGARDSRELVMEKVYEDLMFAAQNITRTTDATQCSYVTKWAAYAFASRVCLFEGTFRKYHNLNLSTSAATWLKRAEDAAYEVMQNSGKSLHANYRELFTIDNPPASETILARAYNRTLSRYHYANPLWITNNHRSNAIRPFVCTYLQKDGTPYTNRAGWQYEDFYEEFQNRDERLDATFRYPGYMREGNIALPLYSTTGILGYHPMKLCVDATAIDFGENSNAIQLLRYGEVLLNFAEAKAEQGTLTDDDWNNTIGALRRRAGITGITNVKPTVVDNFLQETWFPDISDPVVLEIRRERAIELFLEGYRFDDLRRWKCGELLKKSWTGMYIPGVNIPLDVDRNGMHDVIYYTDEAGLAAAEALSNNPEIARVQVSTDPAAEILQIHPAGDGKGYYLAWLTHQDQMRVWGPKQYLYPVPKGAINLNPNLSQNPGWENGARNDGN